MSYARLLDLRRSMAFRLTLSYAALVILSFLTASLVIYFMLRADLSRRLDAELREELEEVAAILRGRTLEEARDDLLREAEFDGVEQIFIRLFDVQGRPVFHSDLSAWESIGRIGSPPAGHGTAHIDTPPAEEAGRAVRVISGPIGEGLIGQIGLSTDDGERLLGNMREVMTTAILVVVALATLIGSLMARRALSGVEQVTDAAMRISEGDLNSRAPLSGRGDEIDRLAQTFNTMVERMQVVLRSMREITDNIAHDLRSPIARIRGRAEMTLTRTASGAGDAEALAADTLEECDRVLAMINTMLDISELETGVARMEAAEVDLGALVTDTCDLFGPAAEECGVELRAKVKPGIFARGDIHGLQRAVANIVDNALKYTPAGGKVTLKLGTDGDAAEIRVRDTGPGIAAEELPRIFDRFYRGDQSRSQRGNGLGLSLARALVEAHGGEIHARSAAGGGSEFVIVLPQRRNGDASPT